MFVCKKLDFDGVAYFSKRESGLFAVVAINLALHADYKRGQEYADICMYPKADEMLNLEGTS